MIKPSNVAIANLPIPDKSFLVVLPMKESTPNITEVIKKVTATVTGLEKDKITLNVIPFTNEYK